MKNTDMQESKDLSDTGLFQMSYNALNVGRDKQQEDSYRMLERKEQALPKTQCDSRIRNEERQVRV